MKITEDLRGFLDQILSLVNAHLNYYKVVAIEQLVKLLAKLIAMLILLITSLIFWLFMSVWLSFVIGTSLNSVGVGFLIMAGVNVLLGGLIYALRVPLFINPFIAWLGTAFEPKEGVV